MRFGGPVPTYSYACTQCDNRFDIVQSFSDDSLTQCPECSGKLRKLFSSVGIVFKGSGFYRTDNRSAGSTVNAQSSESKSESTRSNRSPSPTRSRATPRPSNSEKSKSDSSSKSAPAAIAS